MKRRNLILRNALLIMISGILFLTLLHSVDREYFSNTIGDSFFRTVEGTLKGTRRAVRANELWKNQGQVDDMAIPDDLSVLYVRPNNVTELNQYLASDNFSTYLQTEFLPSEAGQKLLARGTDTLTRIALPRSSDQFRSMYVLVDFSEENDDVLLLAKDLTVWEWYLINTRVFFVLLIIFFIGIVIYFYYIQQKKMYGPVFEMTEAAYQYSENDFSPKLAVKSNDEIGNLATAIMKLGKTLETSTLMNKKEKNLLEHVFDSLSVGIIYVDEDFKLSSLNTAGKHYYSTYVRENDDQFQEKMLEKYEKAVLHCFQTGTGQRMEVQQNQIIFDVRFSPIMEEEAGKVSGVLLMIEEVTNAKRLAAIREELITNVSHDFRTPLSMIIGYSEAIVDDLAETIEEKNEMARIIHDEATQLNQMINSLLNISRLKAGYMELDFQVVKIKNFFDRILSRFADKLARENIQITLEIQDNLESIQMDEERMHHAVYNLIDNAIRYSAEPDARDLRYIRIEVKLDEFLDQVLIVVSDNGIGISEKSIPFIFERFYKDDKARTRPMNNGSGVGLSLVQSIIKKHEGNIDVESTLGEGTSFTIRLPYQQTNYSDLEKVSN